MTFPVIHLHHVVAREMVNYYSPYMMAVLLSNKIDPKSKRDFKLTFYMLFYSLKLKGYVHLPNQSETQTTTSLQIRS